MSIIAALAIALGLGYARWAGKGGRRAGDLERHAVAGRATVTAITHEAGGAIRVAYRFRHPFSGAGHDGAGMLPEAHDVPRVGDDVDIAYLPEEPQRSCLAVELRTRKPTA